MLNNKLIAEYSTSHQNNTNQIVHYFCVPIIFFNVCALLYYYLPFPATGALVIASLIFYYRSLRPLFPLMIISYTILFSLCYFLASVPYFVEANIVLFIVGWIGQFIGHKIEGRNPSFLRNIFFLLVGPAWVAYKLTRSK
jgi:uncharacterized membrane protein YGL010W